MAKHKILVSIITVCYNSEKTIRKTIESVLSQTYSSIDYVIVDGNSSDSTMKIIEEYVDRFRIRYNREMQIISEPDKGIYDAMNKGISLASGEIIGILNSDDYYEVSAVENIVSHMSSSPMQVCYGGIKIYENNKLEKIIWLSHEFLDRRMIAHPACFVTKNIYEKYGMFNTKYSSSADYELMLRIHKQEEIEFVPLFEVVTNYTTGGISTTSLGRKDKIRMLYDTGRIGYLHFWCSLFFLKIESIMKGRV